MSKTYSEWLEQLEKEKHLLKEREEEIDRERRRVRNREKELEEFINEEEGELTKMKRELDSFLVQEERRLKQRESELDKDKEEVQLREKELLELEKKEKARLQVEAPAPPVDVEEKRRVLADKEKELRARETAEEELIRKEEELRKWEDKLRQKEMERLTHLHGELEKKEKELLNKEKELEKILSGLPKTAAPEITLPEKPVKVERGAERAAIGTIDKKIQRIDTALMADKMRKFQTKKERRVQKIEKEMLSTLRDLKKSINTTLKKDILSESILSSEEDESDLSDEDAESILSGGVVKEEEKSNEKKNDNDQPKPDTPSLEKSSMIEKERTLVYLKLVNDSEHTFKEISLTDYLPPDALEVQVHSKADLREENKNVVSWKIGTLDSKETKIMHYSLKTSVTQLPEPTVDFGKKQ
ncbi:hypothetical protein ACFLRC_03180 [Candidatus Altiarchaeota archaeon]